MCTATVLIAKFKTVLQNLPNIAGSGPREEHAGQAADAGHHIRRLAHPTLVPVGV